MRARRTLVVAATAASLLLAGACSNGRAEFSDAFKQSFLRSCTARAGGTPSRCQCALDFLEEHAETEADITQSDIVEAVRHCQSD
jgi:hypothetical protein